MKDEFTKQWIISNSIEIVAHYEPGILTLRGLHYRLVAAGMTNSQRHYKRVVDAMKTARWDGDITFETFSDHDREVLGMTSASVTDLDWEISYGQRQVKAWMENYKKNRWENQEVYPEIWIEKKALQGVFESVCLRHSVALAPCKGYPSLTFLNEAKARFLEAQNRGQKCVIIYFGDYDPSGEDIPRSIAENLWRLGVEVEVKRVLLLEEQVIEWGLPPAPAKSGDSRTANWDGIGQVELDAVEPTKIQQYCKDAIDEIFDEDKYAELMDVQDEEREQYVAALKTFVSEL